MANLKWAGGLEELRAAVDRTGRIGDWIEVDGHHVFRAVEGGVLTWYSKTKTVLVQGSDEGFAAAVDAEIRTPRATLNFDD
ncbi:MAG TPA: hypothetical protein VIL30_11485 [Ramlibacter sp.]